MITINRIGSLEQIASEIADSIGKPFDRITIERLKSIILEERATRIRQSTEKYRLDEEFIQRYTIPLTVVDIGDTGLVTVGVNVLRTTNKIAKPIRTKSEVPFVFVGSPDGEVTFTYTTLSELKHTKNLKYSGTSIRYNYRNGYVYVYSNTLLQWVTIEAPYTNPELIIPTETAQNYTAGIVYDDTMEFPISFDMLNSIKEYIIKTQIGLNPIITDNE